jgi:hypothetical protein
MPTPHGRAQGRLRDVRRGLGPGAHASPRAEHVLKSHHFNAANDGGYNTLWTDPAAQEHLLTLLRELSANLHAFQSTPLPARFSTNPSPTGFTSGSGCPGSVALLIRILTARESTASSR